METLGRILVATDLGPAADRAISTALVLARPFDALVTLLHVAWVPPSSYGYAEGLNWPLEQLEGAAKKSLDELATRIRSQCPRIDTVLAAGEPCEVILETAKSINADLIVLGTHGRRGLRRLFLGSVAEKVVRTSTIPVLTVAADPADGPTER